MTRQGPPARTDKRTPRAKPGADMANSLKLLALMSPVDGKLPPPQELAPMIGLSERGAVNMLSRLRERGILRTSTVVRRDALWCECVAYLRCSLVDQQDLAQLERRLAQDRAVTEAAHISGVHDYRIEAFHSDPAQAQAWFRDLLTHKAVAHGQLRLIKTVLKRL